MHLQATIGLRDLNHFFEKLTPLEIELADTDGPLERIHIQRPDLIEMVPGRGVRLVTTLFMHCKIAGVSIPVTATSARLLLLPAILPKNGHTELAFSFELEDVDLRHVPHLVEEKLLPRINEALSSEKARLSWNFRKTLTFGFALPARVRPVERITLGAGDGAVFIATDGLRFTVSYETDVLRSPAPAEAVTGEPAPASGAAAPSTAPGTGSS
jgi:hypothetical protein